MSRKYKAVFIYKLTEASLFFVPFSLVNRSQRLFRDKQICYHKPLKKWSSFVMITVGWL